MFQYLVSFSPQPFTARGSKWLRFTLLQKALTTSAVRGRASDHAAIFDQEILTEVFGQLARLGVAEKDLLFV